MAKYVLVVPSSPHEGQDDVYKSWYDNVHVHDVCSVPGVKSGRRFIAHAASPNAVPARYLAIYEIETDDPADVVNELGRRGYAGEMVISPALDTSTAAMFIYEER